MKLSHITAAIFLSASAISSAQAQTISVNPQTLIMNFAAGENLLARMAQLTSGQVEAITATTPAAVASAAAPAAPAATADAPQPQADAAPAKPAPAKSTKRASGRHESDEAKARRIAARYGVYW